MKVVLKLGRTLGRVWHENSNYQRDLVRRLHTHGVFLVEGCSGRRNGYHWYINLEIYGIFEP
jgi:hypothetical protein